MYSRLRLSCVCLAAPLIFIVLWSICGSATVEAQDFSQKAEQYVNDFVNRNQFSGTVLVARDGKPLFREGFAFANREWNIPNSPGTKFRLGSITKQFTATAILQLMEAGKLKLDDPISKYYTDAPASWSKITITNLLTHTSGIPSYTDIPAFFEKQAMTDLTPAQIIKLTQDKPLEFEPGTKWKYDNSGYIVLGWVIEKLSGQAYAGYVKQHIFDPLGMRETGYDTAKEIIPHRASGYVFRDGQWFNAPYLAMSLPYAAGSLYSTIDDLLIWDQALYAHKPISAASLEKMFTPYKNHYGFGWMIDEQFNHKHISHGGGINGFNTIISRYPDDKVTIIVLSNVNSGAPAKIANDLARMVFGVPQPKEIPLDPKLLSDYVGTYQFPGLLMTISSDDGRLMLQPQGQSKAELFPMAHDRFFLKVVDAELEFQRDAQGKITKAILHQGGQDLEGQIKR